MPIGSHEAGTLRSTGLVLIIRSTYRPHRAAPLPHRRPSSIKHRRGPQLRRVDGHVPDALALPRIGDVDDSVSALDDGRIRVLARVAFENERGVPRSAVTR